MKRIIVNIGNVSYLCDVAQTEEEKHRGLSLRKSMDPNYGMLFSFDGTYTPQMWMKDTYIALDMIGINEKGKVTKVVTPKPQSEKLINFPNCVWVLEVSANSGIKKGDDFEISQESPDKYVMDIIAPNGAIQGRLQGGERIFSRISTRNIIRKAKQAYNSKEDHSLYEKNCKKLGEYVLKELYAQNHRDPQYVTI